MNYLPDIHRLLPQSVDAERSLLSSFLLAPQWVGELCSERGVTHAHFHLPAHALIYSTLLGMWNDNEPIDIVTATQVLRNRNQLDQAGGAALITELFTFLPTATNATHYINIVIEKYTLRQIIGVCTEFGSRCYEEQDDVPNLLDGVEKAILCIRQGVESEVMERDTRTLMQEVCNEIEDRYDRRGELGGISTGFPELDKQVDGLKPCEMIVLAARPSMGKTALGLSIAVHVAAVLKKTSVFMTLEMSDKQLAQRAMLSEARVNLHAVNQGFLTAGDFPKIQVAATKLAGTNLKIIDCNNATVQAIRAKARRIKRRHPDLALIVIDYLQYMRSNTRQGLNSREREVAEISAGCKGMAKELQIPVIVLAQLNRDAEKRKGEQTGRPRMSDLRESGAIEQDADVIGLLYREEYYAENEEQKRSVEGKAMLIIGKNRNGPVGDIPLTFLKEFARYESRARDEEPEFSEPQKPFRNHQPDA